MASAAWQARNAKAQSLGYRNYYDYRVHQYGKRPASEPAPTGRLLARLRGHGRAPGGRVGEGAREGRRLVREAQAGDYLAVFPHRDAAGELTGVYVTRIPMEGEPAEYLIAGPSDPDFEDAEDWQRWWDDLVDDLDDHDVDFSHDYPAQGVTA